MAEQEMLLDSATIKAAVANCWKPCRISQWSRHERKKTAPDAEAI